MAESLRDQLAASFDKITTAPETPDAVEVDTVDTSAPAESEVAAKEPTPSKIAEAPKAKSEARAAAVAERERDADGKFLPKAEAGATKPAEPVPTAAKIHKAAPAASAAPADPAVAQAPVAPVKPRPPRPSSWKKEYWDHWDKLDPALAEYMHTRESQFAQGVSTYKAEAEAAKPLMEALQQFTPELKQHGVEPTKWITELGHVHRTLALGAPQQKLETLARVAQAYGVPLQALYDPQAQQQYLAQGQHQRPLPPPPHQQMLTRAEAEKLFQEKYLEQSSTQELERFAADTAKHPHFDEVRNTMSGLLQANLADDLESAYQAALRLPAHANLYEADQQQVRAAEEQRRKDAEAQRVLKAKAKAVSPSSATPSGPGSEEKAKGLRSSIAAAFEQHEGGRV